MSRAARFRGCERALLLAAATWGCHASELPVRLAPTGVLIDGAPVAGDREAIGRAFRAHANERRPLVIRLEPGADEARLADVLEHAKATGANEATLETEHWKERVLLRAENRKVPWLVVRAFGDQTDVWLLPAPPLGYRDVASWPIGSTASEPEISERIARACPQDCDVTFYASAGSVVASLTAWRRVFRSQRPLELSVLATPPGATSPQPAAGHLPPDLIQAVVRAHFERFRRCYEQGLAKDASLSGTVNTRFVIELDGRVSAVTDGGSSLPDAGARDCVLRAFETITFPPPRGGVVTVVYPITLTPG